MRMELVYLAAFSTSVTVFLKVPFNLIYSRIVGPDAVEDLIVN